MAPASIDLHADQNALPSAGQRTEINEVSAADSQLHIVIIPGKLQVISACRLPLAMIQVTRDQYHCTCSKLRSGSIILTQAIRA